MKGQELVKHVQSELYDSGKKKAIAKLLPKSMDVERYIHSAMLSISKSARLQKCSPETLVRSVIDAAAMGLDFYPSKGHAYLVPRWSKKRNGYEAHFQPGYKGLIHLCGKSDRILKVEARIAYSNEEFQVIEGTEPRIHHVKIIDPKKRGDRMCVYGVVFFKEGGTQFVVLDFDWIEKHVISKSTSRDKNGKLVGPWVDDRDKMDMKTAIRQILDHVSLGNFQEDYQERMVAAITADNDGYEVGVKEDEDDDIAEIPEPEPEEEPEKPKAKKTSKGKKEPEPEPEIEDATFEEVPEEPEPEEPEPEEPASNSPASAGTTEPMDFF